MRSYNHRLEAAYIRSKRQGDAMRDREYEQGTRIDRSNRYLRDPFGSQRWAGDKESIQAYQSHRPFDSGRRWMSSGVKARKTINDPIIGSMKTCVTD